MGLLRIVSTFEDKMIVTKPRGYYTRLRLKIGATFGAFADHIISRSELWRKYCDLGKGECHLDQHISPFFAW